MTTKKRVWAIAHTRYSFQPSSSDLVGCWYLESAAIIPSQHAVGRIIVRESLGGVIEFQQRAERQGGLCQINIALFQVLDGTLQSRRVIIETLNRCLCLLDVTHRCSILFT